MDYTCPIHGLKRSEHLCLYCRLCFESLTVEQCRITGGDICQSCDEKEKAAVNRLGNARVLVACEYSGMVRDALRRRGIDAMSCDLIPSEKEGPHHIGDVTELLSEGWDGLIAFPPCTYLCASGMHWTTRGLRDPALTEGALTFVRALMDAPIERIAIENSIGCISSRIRKPDQIIQPWNFGHPESKATCLWLKGLPKLQPTIVCQKPASGRWENQTPSGQNKLGPSKDRWKDRSRTYKGIAEAMAGQWYSHLTATRASAAVNLGARHARTTTLTASAPAQTVSQQSLTE